jgi:hypothetical protein
MSLVEGRTLSKCANIVLRLANIIVNLIIVHHVIWVMDPDDIVHQAQCGGIQAWMLMG